VLQRATHRASTDRPASPACDQSARPNCRQLPRSGPNHDPNLPSAASRHSSQVHALPLIRPTNRHHRIPIVVFSPWILSVPPQWPAQPPPVTSPEGRTLFCMLLLHTTPCTHRGQVAAEQPAGMHQKTHAAGPRMVLGPLIDRLDCPLDHFANFSSPRPLAYGQDMLAFTLAHRGQP
jgi:hypothetical protein